VVAIGARVEAGNAGADDAQGEARAVGIGQVKRRNRAAAGELADRELDVQGRGGQALVVGLVAFHEAVVGVDDGDQAVLARLGKVGQVKGSVDRMGALWQLVSGHVGLSDKGVGCIEVGVGRRVELDAYRVRECFVVRAMDFEQGADVVSREQRGGSRVGQAARRQVCREKKPRFEGFEVQSRPVGRLLPSCGPLRAVALDPAIEPAADAAQKREKQRTDAAPTTDVLVKLAHDSTPLGCGRQRPRVAIWRISPRNDERQMAGWATLAAGVVTVPAGTAVALSAETFLQVEQAQGNAGQQQAAGFGNTVLVG